MTRPLLEAKKISKSYANVRALSEASFTVMPGEVVALIGDNGAGKSTFVKCLSGAEQPDSGEIVVDGQVVHLTSPADARRSGIETVYQDLAVAPDLTPTMNLFLGRELVKKGLLGRLGFLDIDAMERRTATAFAGLGGDVKSLRVPINALSGGQRQSVAIARSVAFASRIVFMDEPTAALGVVQRAKVLDSIRMVRDSGISVVLISHNMPEVLSVADRVEVLRRGSRVARFDAADATLEDLVGAMTGAISHDLD